MKLIIPKQHGAWGMLLIPFVLGILIGKGTWYHIPLFLAWLFVYLATYPLLMYVKQPRKKYYLHCFFLYFSVAFVCAIIALMYEWRIVFFSIIMIPCFFINIYYSRQKNERALLNDICAIILFCIGGIISYYFTMKTVDEKIWVIATISFLYFMGSTFYVKTMIREKKNPTYRFVSWGYHSLLVIATLIVSPWFTIAFIPSLVRSILLYGRNISILKVGVLETLNSIYFFISTILLVKAFM
ncbi:YwiC-like family protein [Bacillus sp. DX1.1]|uniref:YwiC-like family protein n=1 Tax=unclassified Bacillus (in: firmicutes) TaxID=185979 RepID=UPI0025707BE8|nr:MULTISPECIES: YwiC-like family protein [unclassified Bacillus (in: firmicutes)]MDM5155648.1 YwiC-like family protein [Bacillus sp. DX1.1]WJE79953.1 YwiC-like family protein [Bacillus sp. DX3.1]